MAALPGGSGLQGMLCDQATAATATVMLYTGSGLSYNGQSLFSEGAGQPLVLATASSLAAAGPGQADMVFTPAVAGESWGPAPCSCPLLLLIVAAGGQAAVWQCCSPAGVVFARPPGPRVGLALCVLQEPCNCFVLVGSLVPRSLPNA
jgi:hypothetical protein